MERQFLQYLLYNGLVLIRALSHGRNRKEIYWLSDLLHNVPLALDSAEGTRENVSTIGAIYPK